MNVTDSRRAFIDRTFPKGMPRLWCPALTHYQAAGEPDFDRISAHLAHLRPFVQGLLIPGSTGEGWEMSDADIRRLLPSMLNVAQSNGMRVLVGVLKTDVTSMLACIESMQPWLDLPAVVGVTVCPPKGSTLTQDEINEGVSKILDLGLPTALYQLPQVTENEMAPNTVSALAAKYSNFYLFKDTSGHDRVATSGVDMHGVFMVRGAEQGGYAAWLKQTNGFYDGFLLSTANVFAEQFDSMLNSIDEGKMDQATRISEFISGIVQSTFAMVASLETGNPFTNANKVLDHCMAYGATSLDHPPPMLYSGVRLPGKFVEQTMNRLSEHGMMPKQGYYVG